MGCAPSRATLSLAPAVDGANLLRSPGRRDTLRMLGIMAVVLVLGAVIVIVGVVLLVNLLGAGDYVMRTVTSKYLGSLPPGYAASKGGFRIYSLLVIAIGVVFAGVGLAGSLVTVGVALIAIGAAVFVVTSVIAIRGEGQTIRRGR